MELFDECGDLAFGQRAEEAVGRLSVHERDDRGILHRIPICPAMVGCSSIFILHSFTLPLAARTSFSRQWGELFARAAPGRPEIDQHGLLTRFVHHVL